MMSCRKFSRSLGLAILALIAGAGFSAAQTVVTMTDPVGFSRVPVAAGGGVVAPVLVKAAVYSGTATVTGQRFSASGLTPNTYGPTSYSNRPNAARYYVEITSGSYAGHNFDVTANASNSITVSGLPAELDGQTNVTITLRPHTTLGDLASAAGGLANYSDSFTVYKPGNAKDLYIYTGSGVVGDDYVTPCSHIAVYPGTGILLNNSFAASFSFSGTVKTNPTVVPIRAGESLLAPLDPQGGVRMSALNIAPVLDPYSDTVSLVSTSGNLGITSFYSDGSGLLDENYNPLSSNNAPAVTAGNGFIINTGNDRKWTNLPAF